MEPKEFCYWLQGYLEISETKELNQKQLQIVKDHMKTVFTKVTPTYSGAGGGTLQLQQEYGGSTLRVLGTLTC